ncbi:MAG: hypothetical protein WCJ19_03775 [bacterium]
MKGFNLYSTKVKELIQKKNSVSIPTWWLGIFITCFFMCLGSIICFFINLYLNNQITTTGNSIINLMSSQSKYNSILTDYEKYTSRTAAIHTINKDRLPLFVVVQNINSITNNTIISYTIDQTTLATTLKGRANTMEEALGYVDKIRSSDSYAFIKVNQLAKQDKTYLYDISLTIKREKLQV